MWLERRSNAGQMCLRPCARQCSVHVYVVRELDHPHAFTVAWQFMRAYLHKMTTSAGVTIVTTMMSRRRVLRLCKELERNLASCGFM